MLVPIRVIFLFAVICCAVGITKGSSADPNGTDESFFNVMRTVAEDLASQSSGRFKKTLQSGSKAFNKVLGVIHSAVDTGLDGTAAVLESGQQFISTTVPEHGKRFQDNLEQPKDALLNHGSNTFARVTQVATGVIKQADELQGTATDGLNNFVEGVGTVAKSAVQNTAKVMGKVNEMSKRALDTVGNVATDPAKYASATVGLVTDGANNGLDYLKEGAKAINPLPLLKTFGSYLGF